MDNPLRRLWPVIILILLLAACQSAPPEADPAPDPGTPAEATTEVAQAPATATMAVAPTETSVPTTATAAAPTATTAATATTEASPTAAPSPSPTTTPLPEGWIGPGDFGDTINPLTGEVVEDPAVLDRRPIAIKISNYPALVRPQAGINNADLVFEHYAEGGVTRWTAIFYSKDAHTVGSVRSARIIDFEIPVMYDAAFGFSGASGPNKERFSQVDWFDRIISPDFGHSGFYRKPLEDPDVDFWHTMFTDTYRLREILVERGEDRRPVLHNGMIFSQEPPEGGTSAKEVEVRYRGNDSFWWYDSGLERYFRWTDGERHLDANRNEQINYKNIVVVAAQHVDTWVPETEVGQGARSVEIQIWGEGPASVFRNGQRFDGRWHRETPEDMLTFTDLDGNTIPLAPGNTWFQLVPLGFDKLYVTP